MALNLTNTEIADWYLKLVDILWPSPNKKWHEHIAYKIMSTKDDIASIFKNWWIQSLPFWTNTSLLISKILTNWVKSSIKEILNEENLKSNNNFPTNVPKQKKIEKSNGYNYDEKEEENEYNVKYDFNSLEPEEVN